MRDPYDVLGVSRNASEEDIKRAYRTASRKYHPDANLDNPKAAEEKFKEVQQAYKAIVDERSGKGTSSYGNSRQGAGNTTGGYGGYGAGTGRQGGQGDHAGGWDFGDFDFGGFWGFGGSDAYGERQRTAKAEYSENDSAQMKAAANYINEGYYKEAIRILNEIRDRNAKWYFFSAVANFEDGNNMLAKQHIDRAVAMDPGNQEYQMYKRQMEGGGDWYRRRSQSYGAPDFGTGNLCFRLCMLNIFCNCICGGGGFCCGAPYRM